jgi:uncharacterized protein (TIGR00304 family)
MDAGTLQTVGLTLVFLGTLTMIIALILTFFRRNRVEEKEKSEADVRGGSAIIIGPIPIIFGTDRKSIKTILLLSIVLTALLIVLEIIIYLTSR